MGSKPKYLVLKRSSDFDNLFKNGKRYRPTHWMVVNFLPNEFRVVRCGWTIPKKVGNAVYRNRLKRWCRSFFSQKSLNENDVGFDLNIVLRACEETNIKAISHKEFSSALEKVWRRVHQGSF